LWDPKFFFYFSYFDQEKQLVYGFMHFGLHSLLLLLRISLLALPLTNRTSEEISHADQRKNNMSRDA